MIKMKIVGIFIALNLLFLGVFAVVLPSAVSAATQQQNAVCQGSELKLDTNVSGSCAKLDEQIKDSNGESKVNNLIAQIINIFSVVVGIAAVIMIIYGGFRYVTSGGEASNITAAKNSILYAIIGLVIVALAQVIVKFVLAKLIGNDN